MGVKWQESTSSNFTVYSSTCGKYTCFKNSGSIMLEDGSVESRTEWTVMMQGRGYTGRWGVLGFFNSSKEATLFINDCESKQIWPEDHVDLRSFLPELRRYVQYHGDIARERRQKEAAEREARELAEAYAENERLTQVRLAEAERVEQARLAREAEAAETARQAEEQARLKAEAKAQAKADAKAVKDAEKAALKAAKDAEKGSKAPAKKSPKKAKPSEEVEQVSLFA